MPLLGVAAGCRCRTLFSGTTAEYLCQMQMPDIAIGLSARFRSYAMLSDVVIGRRCRKQLSEAAVGRRYKSLRCALGFRSRRRKMRLARKPTRSASLPVIMMRQAGNLRFVFRRDRILGCRLVLSRLVIG